jgi:hypothetical protein
MIFQHSASVKNILRRHLYEIIYKQFLGTCGVTDSCPDSSTDTNGKCGCTITIKLRLCNVNERKGIKTASLVLSVIRCPSGSNSLS